MHRQMAQSSIDKLFAEPFTPVWMKRQEEAREQEAQEKRDAWANVIKEYADLNWRLEAERSHRLILKTRCGIDL